MQAQIDDLIWERSRTAIRFETTDGTDLSHLKLYITEAGAEEQPQPKDPGAAESVGPVSPPVPPTDVATKTTPSVGPCCGGSPCAPVPDSPC